MAAAKGVVGKAAEREEEADRLTRPPQRAILREAEGATTLQASNHQKWSDPVPSEEDLPIWVSRRPLAKKGASPVW